MKKGGFTTVELLIAIGVIALVGVGCAVALNSSRARTRDAVRVSNVRQIQAALENYITATNAYPPGEAVPLGATETACLGESGFASSCNGKTYLKIVPATESKGLDGLSSCGAAANAFCYLAIQDASGYRIQFELERDWADAGLRKGINCASPEG